MFEEAAENVSRWTALENSQSELKAARLAIIVAPSIPHIGASLIHLWHGIEAMFPKVDSEVRFRLSILVAQLARPIGSPQDLYKRARLSYQDRSAVAHGRARSIEQPQWTEAFELLRTCLRAVLHRGGLPTEEELLAATLSY
jgi:hypothetical protein